MKLNMLVLIFIHPCTIPTLNPPGTVGRDGLIKQNSQPGPSSTNQVFVVTSNNIQSDRPLLVVTCDNIQSACDNITSVCPLIQQFLVVTCANIQSVCALPVPMEISTKVALQRFNPAFCFRQSRWPKSVLVRDWGNFRQVFIWSLIKSGSFSLEWWWRKEIRWDYRKPSSSITAWLQALLKCQGYNNGFVRIWRWLKISRFIGKPRLGWLVLTRTILSNLTGRSKCAILNNLLALL